MVAVKIKMTLAVVVVTVLFWGRASAQLSNCASAITSLSPCMSFGFGNSSGSTPSSSCCSQLATLVETTPMCLCDVMSGGGAQVLGLVLNRTLTQALSGSCNVQTPPLTDCDNGFGSQNPYSGDGAYSDGANLKIPLLLVILFTFVGSFAPVFSDLA